MCCLVAYVRCPAYSAQGLGLGEMGLSALACEPGADSGLLAPKPPVLVLCSHLSISSATEEAGRLRGNKVAPSEDQSL